MRNDVLKGCIIKKFGSAKTFADSMGFSAGYVSNVINGKTILSESAKKKWSEAIGYAVSTLFGEN